MSYIDDQNAYWNRQGSALSKPQDWQQYLSSGGDPSKFSSYQNWKLQNQRNTGLSQFVDQMDQQDQGNLATRNRFSGDYGTASNALNSFLKTSPENMANIFQPYLTDTQGRISSLLDNPDAIQQSAAYKFRLGQGLEGVNRNMAARGLLGSGNRLAALNDYAQGQASQEYDNQFNRLNSLLGTNTQGYLGEKNANTSAWQAKGNLLGSRYGTAANNLNEANQLTNNQRLGWGKLYADISPRPESWAITNYW